MEPLQFFITDLAGKLVKSYGLDPEEARAEAGRVEAERRSEIAEAMRLGYGVIVFLAARYRLEATFDSGALRRISVREKFGFKVGEFPHFELISQRTVNLPFFTDMVEDEARLGCEILKRGLTEIR